MKEKRELYRRKMEKTIYTDIIAELEEAIVLSNSGKEKESNDAVNAIKEKLEKRIYEIAKVYFQYRTMGSLLPEQPNINIPCNMKICRKQNVRTRCSAFCVAKHTTKRSGEVTPKS